MDWKEIINMAIDRTSKEPRKVLKKAKLTVEEKEQYLELDRLVDEIQVQMNILQSKKQQFYLQLEHRCDCMEASSSQLDDDVTEITFFA